MYPRVEFALLAVVLRRRGTRHRNRIWTRHLVERLIQVPFQSALAHVFSLPCPTSGIFQSVRIPVTASLFILIHSKVGLRSFARCYLKPGEPVCTLRRQSTAEVGMHWRRWPDCAAS